MRAQQAYYNILLKLIYLQSHHKISIFLIFMIPRRTKRQSMNYILILYNSRRFRTVMYT